MEHLLSKFQAKILAGSKVRVLIKVSKYVAPYCKSVKKGTF